MSLGKLATVPCLAWRKDRKAWFMSITIKTKVLDTYGRPLSSLAVMLRGAFKWQCQTCPLSLCRVSGASAGLTRSASRQACAAGPKVP